MKTQIITLESHDDLISVRDRMSWAKSRRILLVWPGFERVSLRPVDLRILQQHSRNLGAELGLVTRGGEVRRDAERFGIPVFGTTAEAQRKPWPRRAAQPVRKHSVSGARAATLRALRDESRSRAPRWTSNVVVRVGSFMLGALAVLAVAGLFVPRATIKMTPISQEQSVLLPVQASTANQAVSITGSVPARALKTEVEGTQSAQVNSKGKVAQDKARGIAQFRNLTQTGLIIPGGTVVYSTTPTSQRFITLNDTRLPGKVDAVVEVPIEALEGGEAGNLPANSIQAVEGTVGASATITNPEPTTGGTDRQTTVPSADDRERVRGVLLGSLEAKARNQLANSIGPHDLLLENTLKAGAVLEEAYDPEPGKPGSLLNLGMRVEYTAQYVAAADLNRLAEAALNASTPAGYAPLAESLEFALGGPPVSDGNGTTHFDLQVQRKLVRDLNIVQATAMVRGLTPVDARRLLRANFELYGLPEIQLSPSWWPWLPLIPFRITVITA